MSRTTMKLRKCLSDYIFSNRGEEKDDGNSDKIPPQPPRPKSLCLGNRDGNDQCVSGSSLEGDGNVNRQQLPDPQEGGQRNDAADNHQHSKQEKYAPSAQPDSRQPEISANDQSAYGPSSQSTGFVNERQADPRNGALRITHQKCKEHEDFPGSSVQQDLRPPEQDDGDNANGIAKLGGDDYGQRTTPEEGAVRMHRRNNENKTVGDSFKEPDLRLPELNGAGSTDYNDHCNMNGQEFSAGNDSVVLRLQQHCVLYQHFASHSPQPDPGPSELNHGSVKEQQLLLGAQIPDKNNSAVAYDRELGQPPQNFNITPSNSPNADTNSDMAHAQGNANKPVVRASILRKCMSDFFASSSESKNGACASGDPPPLLPRSKSLKLNGNEYHECAPSTSSSSGRQNSYEPSVPQASGRQPGYPWNRSEGNSNSSIGDRRQVIDAVRTASMKFRRCLSDFFFPNEEKAPRLPPRPKNQQLIRRNTYGESVPGPPKNDQNSSERAHANQRVPEPHKSSPSERASCAVQPYAPGSSVRASTNSTPCSVTRGASYFATMCKKGWYWGSLTFQQSVDILEGLPDGSFLVRDSGNDKTIFTISYRDNNDTLHRRLNFFDSDVCAGTIYLVEVKKFVRVLRYTPDGREHDVQIPLLYPVSRFSKMRSLLHYSRYVIRQNIRVDHIKYLEIPRSLKGYLEEYYF